MAAGRLIIEAVSGADALYFRIIPRRWFVTWRIKNKRSSFLRNALAAGDVEVELPDGERWRIKQNGLVERI